MKKIKEWIKRHKVASYIGTIVLLIIATYCVLQGIALYYHSINPDDTTLGWKYVGDWFNPMAEGNWWASTIYVGLGIFVLIVILVIHFNKMKK